MAIVFVVLSLIQYLFAPDIYSLAFCVLCAISFSLNAYWGIKQGLKDEKIGFNVIFSVSFFAACYVFPVFIYGIDDTFSLYSFGYNPAVISKSTALANVAYAFYVLGLSYIKKSVHNTSGTHIIYFNKQSVQIILRLNVILFILFVATGGLVYFQDRYLHETMSNNYLFQCVYVLFQALTPLLPISLFEINNPKINRRILLLSLIIVVAILSTGSRTTPLAILLILFYKMASKYKLSLVTIMCLGLLGVMSMAIIGQIRTMGFSVDSMSNATAIDNQLGAWNNISDLFINNRNLYAAYDYVQDNSITYGLTFLGVLISVIPFAQSFIMTLFGLPYYYATSATFFTHQVFGPNPPIGLGSNIVADVYLATGFLGVIVLFYFLGYFIRYSRVKISNNPHSLWAIFYMIMISDSVFICRGMYFENLKGVIWSIIVLKLINNWIIHKRKIKYR